MYANKITIQYNIIVCIYMHVHDIVHMSVFITIHCLETDFDEICVLTTRYQMTCLSLDHEDIHSKTRVGQGTL